MSAMAPLKKPQEEKFLQYKIEGLNHKDSYIKSHPNAARWTDNSILSKASALWNRDDVQARYRHIMGGMAKKARWTAEKANEALEYVIQESVKSIELKGVNNSNAKAIIEAVKELNTVNKLYDDDSKNKGVQINIVRATKKNE